MAHPTSIEQTLAAIQDCMAHTAAPWPDAWRQEYIETIRQAIARGPNTSQYARRLQILQDGFPLYWKAQKFTPERSHFEVRQAQIRWYVENLMDANLPDAEETARLRRQYEDLADHAAAGLLAQFSFLDPNVVQKAKEDHLVDCYRNIDAPLLPIFLTPFSGTQLDQMNSRWHDLRYARVDLWRQLAANTKKSADAHNGAYIQLHPDYMLTEGALNQLSAHLWTLDSSIPDYYEIAVVNDVDSRRRRIEAISQARRREAQLGNTALQAECLSFLLVALLETPACFESSSVREATHGGPEDYSSKEVMAHDMSSLATK